jgi:hypothetical protein
MFLDDDDDKTIAAIYGTYQLATHIDKHYNRAEYRRPPLSGLQWVETKLANETACYNMFRMSPTMFLRLHDLLTQQYGLKLTKKSTSIETLAMFLWMVGVPQSVRQAEDRFERSLGIVHSMFHRVLKCVWRYLLTSLDLGTHISQLCIKGWRTLGFIPSLRTA